ncbi:DUF1823 family protein [Prochlorococcus marinus]|uniref:DUF1823 domain-containing protein n=1 Tax=Prochlorococcus marinus (strain MIT 9211) TaxID=93059 RepID=A9BE08_PROM4|nr:DUF1823 family protein [Prochlorococcus marinus]ABX08318.1 conserved hypothetical protein [Prochlorococcus marinus str. MIT 9211]
MNTVWPLSRSLLMEILVDHISDRFVCILVWERLGYQEKKDVPNLWVAGSDTSIYWSEKFPEAPEVIAQRVGSVYLTRSIPKEHKQSLKKILGFEGYRIDELYPRRTRRATAVNWLLSWILLQGIDLPEQGPLPALLLTPDNPANGHPGDLPIT